MTKDLAILGAGNMAEAIARGLLRGNVLPAARIVACDVSPGRLALFRDELGIAAAGSIAEAATGASTILLSVKPQTMPSVLEELRAAIDPAALVISIAAGISIAKIEAGLAPSSIAVIRTMPNTPMLVDAGMVALAAGTRATPAQLAHAKRLFQPAASVIEVSEDKLDAVTALSGSGPAYFFFLVEQMIAAGISMGMSAEQARTLAVQTAVGSAKMLAESQETPQVLRQRVTSPGGTTHAAISHLETHCVDRAIQEALHAAWRRSQELGQ